MISALRKLRFAIIGQNATSKYLRYAIGEIILVVLGILIALQINNWNEARKDKARAIDYHQRLVEDIDRIEKTSISLYTTAKKVLLTISTTVTALDRGHLATSEEQEAFEYALIWLSRFNYQFSELSTYEEMKSSGDLGLIYNAKIRKDLVNFHDYLVSVDAIFNRLGASINAEQKFMDPYIRPIVDPETLYVTHRYDFKAMATNKEFTNTFSRIAVHWRGNAFFTKRIQEKANRLREQIQKELTQLQ